MGKRFLASVVAGVLLSVIPFTVAHAALVSLFDSPTSSGTSNTISTGGEIYTITDRSRTGTDFYDGSLFGYTSSDFSGLYIGTVTNDNNDSTADLTNLLRYYLGEATLSLSLEKINEPATSGTGFTVAYSSDKRSGTWTATGNPLPTVDFYSIKGGNEYSLYYVDPELSSGFWISDHLAVGKNNNVPEISHITVSFGDPVTPVPEPGTALLFGIGLAGLTGFRKYKKG
jgi:hypothetical protein